MPARLAWFVTALLLATTFGQLAAARNVQAFDVESLNKMSVTNLLAQKRKLIAEIEKHRDTILAFSTLPDLPYFYYCLPPNPPSKSAKRVRLTALLVRTTELKAMANRYRNIVIQAQYGPVSGPQFARLKPPFDERKFFRDLDLAIYYAEEQGRLKKRDFDEEPERQCNEDSKPIDEEPQPEPKPLPADAFFLAGLHRPNTRLEPLADPSGPFCSYTEQRQARDKTLAQWREASAKWEEGINYRKDVRAEFDKWRARPATNDDVALNERAIKVLTEEIANADHFVALFERHRDQANAIDQRVAADKPVDCKIKDPVEGIARPEEPDVEAAPVAEKFCTQREKDLALDEAQRRTNQANKQFRRASDYAEKIARELEKLRVARPISDANAMRAGDLESEQNWAEENRKHKLDIANTREAEEQARRDKPVVECRPPVSTGDAADGPKVTDGAGCPSFAPDVRIRILAPHAAAMMEKFKQRPIAFATRNYKPYYNGLVERWVMFLKVYYAICATPEDLKAYPPEISSLLSVMPGHRLPGSTAGDTVIGPEAVRKRMESYYSTDIGALRQSLPQTAGPTFGGAPR